MTWDVAVEKIQAVLRQVVTGGTGSSNNTDQVVGG
jgi:hypothetical protein